MEMEEVNSLIDNLNNQILDLSESDGDTKQYPANFREDTGKEGWTSPDSKLLIFWANSRILTLWIFYSVYLLYHSICIFCIDKTTF
jgi:hypothetical protein